MLKRKDRLDMLDIMSIANRENLEDIWSLAMTLLAADNEGQLKEGQENLKMLVKECVERGLEGEEDIPMA